MRGLAGVALFLVLAVTSMPGWAADQVRTRGWGYADYGRLVFDWPAPVQYSARIENGSLVVRFERSMTTNFTSALARLSEYVSAGNLSADGLVASFQLTNEFTVHPFTNANSVVVDIRRAAAGTQAASSDTTATAQTPALRVRVGQHPGYTRLVFDWTRSVQYTVNQQGRALRLRFDRPARINPAQVQGSLPEGFANIAGSIDAGALTVSMNVPSDSRVRHFRSGTKVVLDVIKGTGEAKAEAAPIPKASDSAEASSATAPVAAKAPPSPPAAAVEGAVSQSVVPEVAPSSQVSQEDAAQDASTETTAGPTRLVRRGE